MRKLKSPTISSIRKRFLTKIDTGEIKHPSALVDAMERVKEALYEYIYTWAYETIRYLSDGRWILEVSLRSSSKILREEIESYGEVPKSAELS